MGMGCTGVSLVTLPRDYDDTMGKEGGRRQPGQANTSPLDRDNYDRRPIRIQRWGIPSAARRQKYTKNKLLTRMNIRKKSLLKSHRKTSRKQRKTALKIA